MRAQSMLHVTMLYITDIGTLRSEQHDIWDYIQMEQAHLPNHHNLGKSRRAWNSLLVGPLHKMIADQ